MCYSLDVYNSINNIFNKWLVEIKNYDIPYLIIKNKKDIIEKPNAKLIENALIYNLDIIKISAKQDINIDKIFNKVIDLYLDNTIKIHKNICNLM